MAAFVPSRRCIPAANPVTENVPSWGGQSTLSRGRMGNAVSISPLRNKVLIVDKDAGTCEILASLLTGSGFEPVAYLHPGKVIDDPDGTQYLLAFIDVRLPEISGLDLAAALKRQGRLEEVVFMSSSGSVDHPIQAIKVGAYDYLKKPLQRQRTEHAHHPLQGAAQAAPGGARGRRTAHRADPESPPAALHPASGFLAGIRQPHLPSHAGLHAPRGSGHARLVHGPGAPSRSGGHWPRLCAFLRAGQAPGRRVPPAAPQGPGAARHHAHPALRRCLSRLRGGHLHRHHGPRLSGTFAGAE